MSEPLCDRFVMPSDAGNNCQRCGWTQSTHEDPNRRALVSDTVQERLDALAALDQAAQNVLLGSLVTMVSGEQWTLALRLVDQIGAEMAAAREDAK